MKIKELIDFIGIYEPIRILNSEFDEVERDIAQNLSGEILGKSIKAVYVDKSVVNIIIK